MRVLDIDLDFFLNKVALNKSFDGIRLDEEEYIPWSKKNVINFFENILGLNKDDKNEGVVVKEHIGVFYAIKELINTDNLKAPFEVVHVDAHADLGLDDAAWSCIFTEILGVPIEKRLGEIESINEIGYQLSSGNYLLFMLAMEWISKLVYIPHYNERGDDYPQLIMKNFEDESKIIQLKHYINDIDDYKNLDEQEYIKQKEVPFYILTKDAIGQLEKGFDYVFLSQSLSYTPESSDYIIDIFYDYIDTRSFFDKVKS